MSMIVGRADSEVVRRTVTGGIVTSMDVQDVAGPRVSRKPDALVDTGAIVLEQCSAAVDSVGRGLAPVRYMDAKSLP